MSDICSICVGDEVRYVNSNRTFVVSAVDPSGMISGFNARGDMFCDKNPLCWMKTGRHFPEMAELLEKDRRDGMSWVKAISDSITQKAPRRETLGLIQGGISAVTVQVQRAIDATDPADYPLLLAVLEMNAASFRQTLPKDAQFLADLIKSQTRSVAVAVPADFRQKEGGK